MKTYMKANGRPNRPRDHRKSRLARGKTALSVGRPRKLSPWRGVWPIVEGTATRMVAEAGNSDVLADVVARVLAAGATEFEVEYEDGEEQVVAFSGAVGIGVAAFPSDSDEARELRSQLYALRKKPRKITQAGVKYGLRVKIFESFGEDVFRVTITRG